MNMLARITRAVLFALCLGSVIWANLTTLIELSHVTYATNRAIFAIMDLQVRTFHYSAGHPGKVKGCRECYRDVHEYLRGLEKEHPEWIIMD